jgi:hypothetical protein
MVSTTANEATHAMAMKEFTPVKDGTMIYVSGGSCFSFSDVSIRKLCRPPWWSVYM